MDESSYLKMAMLFAIGAGPVCILAAYIWLRDKYEKEPTGLLCLVFLAGIAVLFPTGWFEVCLMNLWDSESWSGWHGALGNAFLIAAIPEEVVKFLILYCIIWRNKNFNEHFDGIVYAVFISLGFACIENILYIASAEITNGTGQSIGYARAFFSIPCHFLCAVMMGYFFSLARFSAPHMKKYLAMSLIFPILAHGLFNTLVFLLASNNASKTAGLIFGSFLIFNIILWERGMKKIRHLSELSRGDHPERVEESEEQSIAKRG